jgi:isoquinoline 1-oxidoreductase alpha subunit
MFQGPQESLMKYEIRINGETKAVEADPDTPLLWVLRDELSLTATKFGCGVAQCGACTVHLDGAPIRSCVLPVDAVGDGKVTTFEGLAGDVAEAVQDAWEELQVPQCGYCQTGQMMSAVALLSQEPKPDDGAIDGAMNGNVCRCATYPRIRKAVHSAAKALEG